MDRIVFLVGAGRSGTTLLYKLLALHPQVRVITNYDVRASWMPVGTMLRLLRPFPGLKKALWFDAEGSAYFEHGLRRLIPLPAEGEPLYAKCGMPLVPDESDTPPEMIAGLRREFAALLRSGGGSVLLTKRTANNRRLHWLRDAFPDARFINLMRDGRDVAYSLSQVKWWPLHSVWWAGKKPQDLQAEGWDPLQICARNWVEDVTSVEKGLSGLDPERRLDLRYEDLVQDCEGILDRVWDFMGLEKSPSLDRAVKALGLREQSPKWAKRWSSDQIATVLQEQGALLAQQGYR